MTTSTRSERAGGWRRASASGEAQVWPRPKLGTRPRAAAHSLGAIRSTVWTCRAPVFFGGGFAGRCIPCAKSRASTVGSVVRAGQGESSDGGALPGTDPRCGRACLAWGRSRHVAWWSRVNRIKSDKCKYSEYKSYQRYRGRDQRAHTTQHSRVLHDCTLPLVSWPEDLRNHSRPARPGGQGATDTCTASRTPHEAFGIARKTATSPVSTVIVSGGSPSLRTPVAVTVTSMLQMGLRGLTFVTLPVAFTTSPTRTGAEYLRFCYMRTEPGPGSFIATNAFSAPLWIPPCPKTVDSAYALSK